MMKAVGAGYLPEVSLVPARARACSPPLHSSGMSTDPAGSSNVRGTRTPEEMVWVHLQPVLKDHGYLLRPRYSPDWIPSWNGQGTASEAARLRAEDGLLLPVCLFEWPTGS